MVVILTFLVLIVDLNLRAHNIGVMSTIFIWMVEGHFSPVVELF